MAVVRTSPLPPGRYWVVVFERDALEWSLWTRRYADRVKVRATQGLDPGSVLENLLGGNAPAEWVQFDVTEPVPWEGPGFPNSIPEGIPVPTSWGEVVQAPEPEPTTEERLSSIGTTLIWGAVAFGIGLVLVNKLTK